MSVKICAYVLLTRTACHWYLVNKGEDDCGLEKPCPGPLFSYGLICFANSITHCLIIKTDSIFVSF